MKRKIDVLGSKEYDLTVVGGGIFGVCAAWEAASRGLEVALVEQGDFAQATSSNSYKIAHGGVRYLQHGDLVRARRSCKERSALLRVAPHLVHPQPILVPTYGHGKEGKELMRVGLGFYDLLTFDRNRGIEDPDRRVPSTRFLSREEVLRRFPALPANRLTGAAVFHDGQMYSPPRLALSFLRSAVETGADVANYLRAVELPRGEGGVQGVRVRDELGDRELTVQSKLVLNATGPWAHRFLEETLDLRLGAKEPSFSRDVGLVTRRQLDPSLGLACPTVTSDAEAIVDRGARHLFLMPWRDFTLVGVWHGASDAPPYEVEVREEEVEQFVSEANEAYTGLDLALDDVLMVNTGLILYGDDEEEGGEHTFGKRSILVDHHVEHGLEGLITMIGVRATMARGVSESAVDLAFDKLGRERTPSRTEDTLIYGGDFPSFEELMTEVAASRVPLPKGAGVHWALAHKYGSRFRDVLAHCEDEPDLGRVLGDSSVLRAEVVHGVRREMAVRLSDVVMRRTDLGTARYPGEAALRECADLMARELGWDDARWKEEVREVESFFRRKGALRAYGPHGEDAARRPRSGTSAGGRT